MALRLPVCLLGMISLKHWASATERVLKLGLPWRVLRSQLFNSTQDGMLDYQQWIRELSITEPKPEVCLIQYIVVWFFLSHPVPLPLSLTHTQIQQNVYTMY